MFTAFLFGRRGCFLTALVNILWEIQRFWLGRSFEELFTINNGVDVRPQITTVGLSPKFIIPRVLSDIVNKGLPKRSAQ